MSQKIVLIALLIAFAPLAGLADDTFAEKKSDEQSQKQERDSSDVRRSEEKRKEKYKKQGQKRGKDANKGGRNPSPDA